MRIIRNIRYDSLKNAYIDFFLPEKNAFDLIIWFHGGGLESGDRKNPAFAEQLTENGYGVASVEYRMYPIAKFPDYIVDGANAVKFVTDNANEYGEINRFIVSGQSAGAYITMMLALDGHYFHDARVDKNKIYAYVSDSAQVTTHFNVLKERGMDSRLERIDDAAPFYYLSEKSDFKNLLLIYYSHDICCRPEQNALFYKSAKRLCPNQNIQLVELPGEHCSGSSMINAVGEYDYNRALIKFISDSKN